MTKEQDDLADGFGPFYIRKDCCLSCGVPQMVAPELFAWDEENSCKLKCQPKTKDEVDSAVRVIASQDVGCIGYGGDDPELLMRFAEIGEEEQCDIKPPSGSGRMFRSQVIFNIVKQAAGFTVLSLINVFKSYLRIENGKVLESISDVLSAEKLSDITYRFTETQESNGTAAFSYSWSEGHQHTIEIVELSEEEGRWLKRHLPGDAVGSWSVSCAIHDWLISDGRFHSLHWYPIGDLKSESQWRETPW